MMDEEDSDTEETTTVCANKFLVLFKVILFLSCLAGFVFQVMQYLNHYWTYPSVIDIMVENNRDFDFPSVTFCDSNSIMRSKYCKHYFWKCSNFSALNFYYADYPHFCKGCVETNQVPHLEWLTNYDNIPLGVLKKLGQNLTNFLVLRGKSASDDIEGPFFYRDIETTHKVACYTLHSRYTDTRDHRRMSIGNKTEELSHNRIIRNLAFTLDPKELFDPWIMSGVYFQIHSPYVYVNPALDGVLMKPGRKYKFHLRLEEEQLLPFPYKTDCVNYTSIWELNNKTGPRSQMMCVEQCDVEYDLACYGCIEIMNKYPTSSKCEDGHTVCSVELSLRLMEKRRNCASKCKPDCVKLKYRYSVQEGTIGSFFYRHPTEKEFIHAIVLIDEPEILVRKHNPQYQDVELFSYIGGFLGIWLGISLFAFADFIACIYSYARSHMLRCSRWKKH